MLPLWKWPFARIYQASSSEMFGNADEVCTEHTPMNPTSPYGASKMAAHRLLAVYRGRGLFAVGGILFNHESPRRGPEMVTRKITLAAARWMHGDRTKLKLGNLEARRDWGFAGDYVGAMHAMLQRPEPKDYVIGTGKSHSIAEFIGQVLLRTGEIHDLRADASVARMELGWKPRVDFPGLVRLMVQADLAAFGRHLRSARAAAAAPHQV